MKPTKIRNRKIYRAMNQTISKQICATLSKDLRKKYPRRSARIMIDDTVKVIRGEYKGLTGKVAKISTESNSIAIEGNKKEKLKGEKVDVYIHSTNMVITSLNTDDKWRLKILEKKSKSKIKAMKEAEMLAQEQLVKFIHGIQSDMVKDVSSTIKMISNKHGTSVEEVNRLSEIIKESSGGVLKNISSFYRWVSDDKYEYFVAVGVGIKEKDKYYPK